jgi:hypothetical protein
VSTGLIDCERLQIDEADALIGDKLAESRRLVGAPGIMSVEISDIESGEIE